MVLEKLMSLEVWSSLMTFIGGLFLTVDAIQATRQVQTEEGGKRLLARIKGKEKIILFTDTTEASKSLETENDLRTWLSSKVQYRSRFGFGLVALGFLLDLIVKLSSH